MPRRRPRSRRKALAAGETPAAELVAAAALAVAARAAAVAVAQAAELLEVVYADLAAGPPEVARVDLVAAECRREEG